MLRRSLVLAPLVALGAAWLGTTLERTWLAYLLAACVGLVAAIALQRTARRRIGEVADVVRGLTEGEPTTQLPARGSAEWRRLQTALGDVQSTIDERFEALSAERARVERLLGVLPTAVLLFTERELAYANPAGEEMFALSDGTGLSPLQVLGVRGLVDALGAARASGRTVEVEVTRDERELRARATVTTEGEVILAVTDLTDTRRVETMRRDFVTNASHELKTPVAGIQALSESLGLALDKDPARARTMVERLQQEVLRLSRLVRDLLDLTRLEETTDEQRWVRIDLAAMVRRQAQRAGELAAQRNIQVVCEVDSDLGVVGLPQDMRLIVSNLLDNAVRHNRDGGEIRITLRRVHADAVLQVSDTGPGIAEDDQDRIFERFYRVDHGRSRAAGGTGLGLSIVRNAVQRHGGRVSVHSVLGRGSTFTVVLPVEGRS